MKKEQKCSGHFFALKYGEKTNESKSAKFSKEPAFINREKEMSFLQQWISERPEAVLFIYGPKSCGKTTLLMRFCASLKNNSQNNSPNSLYDVKSINLRKIFIGGYPDFIKAFFGIDTSSQKADVKEIREYNLKLFKLKVEALKGLDSGMLDPFSVMEKELEKINEKGRLPVLIIDELQALADIYMNGQRDLIKELFNFFVAMTKESHLCHIIVSSADGYFIERIYNDSRMRKTSDFFRVDYLEKEDVIYWLSNLKSESCINTYKLTSDQQERIWQMFGGSMWEISRFLGDLLSGAENASIPDEFFSQLLEKKRIVMHSHFNEYAGLSQAKMKLFRKIYKKIRQNRHFALIDFVDLLDNGIYPTETSIREELHTLVTNNFIAFDPTTAKYSMQGKSMEHGLEMYVKSLKNN
jgi:uncharacterized protein